MHTLCCPAAGEQAAAALRKKLGSQQISCEVRSRDQYRRSVAACKVPGGEDINRWMVDNGLAVAYRWHLDPFGLAI